MFCYDENCNGECKNCEKVTKLFSFPLQFMKFTKIEAIKFSQEVLCLVSSWEEPPYFIVMKRVEKGMVNSYNNEVLENTTILLYAYLPHD